MSGAQTLDSKVMKYSADCVEWCPIKEFHDIFACGTYQLIKDESENTSSTVSRLGCINIFKVNQQGSLILQQCLDTAAILDMKWCHQTNLLGEPILAIATSEGTVAIYHLKKRDEDVQLLFIKSINCVEEEGTLALFLEWSTGSDDGLKVVISDSKGSIHVLRMNEGDLEKVHHWSAHSHEAWVATFDNQDPNLVYSGGDDCRLVVYDIRQKYPVLSLKKEHNSGVTSLSCEKKHNVLASGSYDEILRLWDKRNWKLPTSEINLGGGVWRIKWNPCLHGPLNNKLVVACMHAGFKVVDSSAIWDGGLMSESLTYKAHDSLAYGCDWCHSETPAELLSNDKPSIKGLVATCSFYDHKLCLWSIQ